MMLKYIKLTVVTSIGFCLFSCKNITTDPEIIKVDPEKKYEATVKVDIKSIIKIETKDSSLIGEINNIEYFENKIYILDKRYSKSLMVFRNDGKFINKTKLGKGPGEMITPWGFSIDKIERRVLVWDMNLSSFFSFDLDLNYISQKLSTNLIRDFVITGKDTILANSFKIKDEAKHLVTSYATYTDNFQKVTGTFLPVNRVLELDWYNKTISQFDRTLFIGYWDYNIYQIINNKVNSIYYWDFGKYTLSEDELPLSYSEKWDKVLSGKRVGSLCDFVESKNFISVSINFKNDKIVYFYSKQKKKVFTLSDYIKNNFLPRFSIGNVVGEDIFLGIVEAKDYIFFKNSTKHYNSIVDNVEGNDNPVIILFKIIE